MQIEVEDNPNCAGSGQFVFNELEKPRRVAGLLAEIGGRETRCEVSAVSGPGRFGEAWAVKIADSGAGFAWLIYGGAWGIRLKPEGGAGAPWSFDDKRQWGEPFKIYGEENEILFA